MSQKKTMTKRRSWAQIKRAKTGSEERRVGYRHANEGFELAERVRQARERLGITRAELATPLCPDCARASRHLWTAERNRANLVNSAGCSRKCSPDQFPVFDPSASWI